MIIDERDPYFQLIQYYVDSFLSFNLTFYLLHMSNTCQTVLGHVVITSYLAVTV